MGYDDALEFKLARDEFFNFEGAFDIDFVRLQEGRGVFGRVGKTPLDRL